MHWYNSWNFSKATKSLQDHSPVDNKYWFLNIAKCWHIKQDTHLLCVYNVYLSYHSDGMSRLLYLYKGLNINMWPPGDTATMWPLERWCIGRFSPVSFLQAGSDIAISLETSMTEWRISVFLDVTSLPAKKKKKKTLSLFTNWLGCRCSINFILQISYHHKSMASGGIVICWHHLYSLRFVYHTK